MPSTNDHPELLGDTTNKSITTHELNQLPRTIFLDRLPREIWMKIFSTLSFTRYDGPSEYDSLHPKHPNWVLSAVCQDRRSFVESLPHIWARIRLTWSLRRLEDNPAILQTRLARVLQNTATMPLLIYMDFCPLNRGKQFGRSYKSSIYKPLAEELVPLHRRWKDLSIRDFEPHFLQHAFWLLSAETDIINFAALEVLRNQCHQDSHHGLSLAREHLSFSATFPRLRTCLLGGRISETTIPAFIPCSQLEDVEAAGARNITFLLPLFTQAKRISIIQILDRQDEEGFHNEAMAEFNDVLSTISIRPGEPVTLIHLKEVVLNYWVPEHLPHHFSAPNLTVVNIETILNQGALESLVSFLSRSDCSLRVLLIRHIEFAPPHSLLLQLLKAIPDVESLHIGLAQDLQYVDREEHNLQVQYEESANDLVNLLNHKSGTKQARTYDLCPRLELLVLHIDHYDYGLYTYPRYHYGSLRIFDLSAFTHMVKWRSAEPSTTDAIVVQDSDATSPQHRHRTGKLKLVQLLSYIYVHPYSDLEEDLTELKELNVDFLVPGHDGCPGSLESERWKDPWTRQIYR